MSTTVRRLVLLRRGDRGAWLNAPGSSDPHSSKPAGADHAVDVLPGELMACSILEDGKHEGMVGDG